MASGYLYVLLNPGLAPGFCKVGMTTRQPEERAAELSRTSGLPAPFQVAYAEAVGDVTAAERAAHAQLSSYRVSDDREFFRVELKVAIRVVAEVAREHASACPDAPLIRMRVRGVFPPSDSAVSIYLDGRVRLDRSGFLEEEPMSSEWSVPSRSVKRMLKALDDCRFLELGQAYCLHVTDYPIRTLEVSLPDGSVKVVEVGYSSDELAPEDLMHAFGSIWTDSKAADNQEDEG